MIRPPSSLAALLDRLPPAGEDRSAERATTALGLVRGGIGIMLLAAPTLLTRLLGADRTTARRLGYLTRMTGVRELALGAGTLGALRQGEDARPWVLAQALSDAGDAAVLAAAVRARHVRRLPAALIVVAGVAGAVLDMRLVRRSAR